MKIISSITTYFSHSNQATHHLKHEMKMERDKRGIEVAGVTRFSTFSIHASSISRCFPAIQRCLTTGTVKFDTAVVSHPYEASISISQCSRQNLFASTSRMARAHISFSQTYITSIWCLHPSHVGWRHLRVKTPLAPMFLTFTLALLLATTQSFLILVSPLPLPRKLIYAYDSWSYTASPMYKWRSQTFAVYNRRFNNLMRDSTQDMFLLAYLLDPSKLVLLIDRELYGWYRLISLLPRWCTPFAPAIACKFQTGNRRAHSDPLDQVSPLDVGQRAAPGWSREQRWWSNISSSDDW